MSADVPITLATFAGRTCASSGSPWEPVFGYSRAVRSGAFIAVSGTVGLNADRSYPATLAEQTRQAFEIVRGAIEALGGTLEHVVRTRMFVLDIDEAREATAVHGEFFRDIRPACTLLEVSRLIDDRALIEIEADAIVG
ncbi:MAG TPA: RidA family protein [Candidatus Binatia bacterium]|nr:RidA family protein [Candidatus Binatia bacterium]